MNRSSWLRRHHSTITAAGFLLLFALLLTYPLPLHLTTRAPGDGSDDPAIIWNLWWVRHALLDLGQNPFSTDFMFFPIGINLAFYTLTVLNALITLPVQLLFGLIPANSAVIYLELTLAGLGMYLLAKDLLPEPVPATSRHRAALLAAITYTFAGHKFVFLSLGQFNIASTHWLPFYVLYLRRALRAPHRRRDAALAAIFLLFNGWTEFTYASFALIFTALFAIYSLVRRPSGTGFLHNAGDKVRALLWIAIPFTLGMAPILAMMIPDLLREGDFTVVGLGFADVFSNDLLGFFVPGHLHPLWGGLAQRFDLAYLNFAYLGYTALTLGLFGLWKWRRHTETRFWALAGAAFVIISFGPTIRLNGASLDLALPFDLLLTLPFFKANRYPGRYSVMIALCLAALVAYGLAALETGQTGRRPQATLRAPRFTRHVSHISLLPFLLLAGLILMENLSIPLPLSDYGVPPVYRAIAAESDDGSVLEIPLAWRNGFRVTGPLHNAFMFAQFYQTVHEKRLLGGNTSRNPEFKFQYFTEAPVINSLLALETGHTLPPGTVEHDRALATATLRFFRVRYIVVHKLNSQKRQITPQAAIPYIEQALPVTKWFSDDHLIVYRTILENAPQVGQLSADAPLADLAFAEGWGPAADGIRWATQRDTRLFLPLDADAYTLTLEMVAPAGGQTVSVTVAGKVIGRRRLEAGQHAVSIPVPADLRRQSPSAVQLHFGRLFPPPSAPPGGWPVGESGVAVPRAILVESAGEEVGNRAHIFLDGQDVAEGGRGFNLVAMDPADGAVTARATFDTHLDPDASHQLATFVAALPPGQIVAVAIADEGSRLLGDGAVAALQTLGLTQALQGEAHFRWSYAALGVKGASPGSVLEAASGIRPVRVGVGPAIREPAVAAGLATVTWEPGDGR